METHQKDDELIDNVTPDGECEDQLESWDWLLPHMRLGIIGLGPSEATKELTSGCGKSFPRYSAGWTLDMVYLRNQNNTGVCSRVTEII